MGNTCTPSPSNKKAYITDLGKVLVSENGKKKYYKPEEVKKAHQKTRWFNVVDFCWGMSTYSSHSDFDKYHEEAGELCDYIGMKTEMLSGLSNTTIDDWTGVSDLDIDASWLDFGDVFDGLLEGIGDLIGGIFDGL